MGNSYPQTPPLENSNLQAWLLRKHRSKTRWGYNHPDPAREVTDLESAGEVTIPTLLGETRKVWHRTPVDSSNLGIQHLNPVLAFHF